MKPLVVTTLLASLAVLCPVASQADPNYIPSVNLTSPADGSTYTIGWNAQGDYGATIPISVTSQSIQITRAPPFTYVMAGWAMEVFTKATVINKVRTVYFGQDEASPSTSIFVDSTGQYRRWAAYSIYGAISPGAHVTQGGTVAVFAGSSLLDPQGNAHAVSYTHTVTVNYSG